MLTRPAQTYGPARVCALLCALLGTLFSTLNVAQGQMIDPSDLWFRAFLLLKEGEGLEQNDSLGALNKYVESKRMLDGLASDHPNFHEEIVRFRRQELAQKIPALRQLLAQGITKGVPNRGSGATPMPQLSQTTGDVAMAPPGLPTWNEQRAPMRDQYQQPKILSPPGTAATAPSNYGQTSTSQGRVDPYAMIQQAHREQENKIAQLTQLNLTLQTQIAERNQRFAEMERTVQNAQLRVKQLEQEKAQADARANEDQDAKAEAARLANLYENAMVEWKKSLDLNVKMAEEKKAMEAEIQGLLAEKAKIEKERDQLRAIVDSSGNEAKQQIAELTKDNQNLRKKLEETRTLAEQLASQNADRAEEIAERDLMIVELKNRVTEIDDERKRLIAENQSYEASIDDLKSQLQQLASGTMSPESIEIASADPQLGAENVLLRNVVLRQIRRQNQIKQSRELLIEELNRIGPEAQTLLSMVDDMFKESGLTQAEKEMFRDDPAALDTIATAPDESVSIAITVDADSVLERQAIEEELAQIQDVARLASKEGDYGKAESQYRKYLSYRPRNHTAIANLALVKMKTKQYKDAVPLLEKAIAVKNDYAHAYYLLGTTLRKQGKPDEALVRLQESIHYEPKHSRAYNCVGVISSEKGLPTKAETAFLKAVEIDPKYADAHFNLAVLYATREQPNPQKSGKHYFRAVGLGADRDGAIEQFLEAGNISATASTSKDRQVVISSIY